MNDRATERHAAIVALVRTGLSTPALQTAVAVGLDQLQVRGDFAAEGYTGYDYHAQAWITVNAQGEEVQS
jgi:hypothetical protein